MARLYVTNHSFIIHFQFCSIQPGHLEDLNICLQLSLEGTFRALSLSSHVVSLRPITNLVAALWILSTSLYKVWVSGWTSVYGVWVPQQR